MPGAPPVPDTVAPGDGNAATLANARNAVCNAGAVSVEIDDVVFAPTVAVYAVTPEAIVNVFATSSVEASTTSKMSPLASVV